MKKKQSTTSHLHPCSSLYSPPVDANENSNQEEFDSDAGTLHKPKREKISNIKCSNESLLEKKLKLQSKNATADERVKESDAKHNHITK